MFIAVGEATAGVVSTTYRNIRSNI